MPRASHSAPLATDRLSAAFQKRRRAPARLLSFTLVLACVIAAGLIARFGTPLTRGLAAGVLALSIAQLFVRRARDARDFSDVRRTIRRVLVPVDRALGERALRAAALAEQAERDPRVGSLELARLHSERQLARASLEAVEARGARGAAWYRGAAIVLIALTALAIGRDPTRVFEGLDVLVARHGQAPVPMIWLDLARVTAQPPAYLHAPDRAIFSGFGSAEAQGSTIVVRGVPLIAGRHLVLSDGKNEAPFVDDGAGGVVARYTLNQTADLRVAARFGAVLVSEPDHLTIESIPDLPPVVALEGAPDRIELRDFDRRELHFEASDDHGLREIDLVLRAGGREDRRSLMRLDGEARAERGAYAIESSDAFLRRTFLPVELSVEARDDNAASGVKWGKSEVITLLPVPIGEPEALRYQALQSARDALTDLLARELAPQAGVSDADRSKADQASTAAVAAQLKAALEQRFAGLRMTPGLKAFLGGQARVLERPLPTPASAMHRTEDVLLAVDAALRGLGNRDAETVSKHLGDAAEEVADGAKEALETERREDGLRRVLRALEVLDVGSDHLVILGPLGRDVGSVAHGEIRRIRRARDAGNLLATELAARHLAARLRRPAPSFGTAGGGGVESGSGSQSGGENGQPSDADKKFDELVGELERLAEEHQQELDRVDHALSESEKSVDLDDLKQEAAERANALREKLARLPQFSDDPTSARASAALGREHADAMAQSMSRLSLKDAVESGRHAKSELDDAAKKSKNDSGFDFLDQEGLDAARSELDRDLSWAEQALARAEKSAAEKAQPSLSDSSGRERSLAERAGNLAGRGNHGEIALPEDLADALGKAEGLMRDAAKELGAGHGEQGLALQRDAQRLLEQSNSGQSNGGDNDSKDQHQQSQSQNSSDGKGKQMSTEADVPKPDSGARASDLRKRILEGLAKEKSGRLSDAVRRYAEGLLK